MKVTSRCPRRLRRCPRGAGCRWARRGAAGVSLGHRALCVQLQQEFSDTSLQTMMFTPELQDLQQRGLTMNQATLGLAIGGGALVIAGATWLGVAIHQRKVIQSANTNR